MQDRFSMSSGVASLISSAIQGRSDSVRFLLSGSLSQMSAQEQFLLGAGFTVGRSDVYPCFHTEDEFKRALEAIWKNRVAGWWHYDGRYVKYGICTLDEFRTALDVECTDTERR